MIHQQRDRRAHKSCHRPAAGCLSGRLDAIRSAGIRRAGIETLEQRLLLAVQPIISEFMAINEDTVLDGDGLPSDWIEIYNAGDEKVNLAGYRLTDDPLIPDKWTFPTKVLEPGEFFLIFASGEHRDSKGNLITPYFDSKGFLHANFSLNGSADYLALLSPTGATLSEFNYPDQREDVSFGIGQTVIHNSLVSEGSPISALIPTTSNGGDKLGITWTGSPIHEPFNDSLWSPGTQGAGYGDFTPPLAIAGELFVDLDAAHTSAGTSSWQNNGTLGNFTRVGAPLKTTVDGAAAVRFNGTATLDAYQSVVDAPAGLVGPNPTRTIEVWVHNPGIATEETVVAWGRRGGPAGTNMSFNYGTSAAFGAVGHWDTPDIGWNPVPPGGQWHHLVYTFDGATTRVYADGQLNNVEELGFNVINTHAGTKVTLAAQIENAAGTLNTALRGTLSLGQVRIHDGVLTPEQVFNNYNLERVKYAPPPPPVPEKIPQPPEHRYSFNDGTANDSIGGRNGTLINGSSIANGQVSFNGASQYVSLNGNNIATLASSAGAVSIETWGTYDSTTGVWSRIFDFGDTNPSSSAGRNYIFLTPRGGNGVARAAISNADPGFNGENLIEGQNISSGTVVHSVAVFNDAADEMSLFINGNLVAQGPMSIPLSAVSNVHGYIGRSLYNDPYLIGSIDEFRIYDYALTRNQALGNFQAGPNTVNVAQNFAAAVQQPAAPAEPVPVADGFFGKPQIGLNLQSAMQNVNSSAFIRAEFSLANPDAVNALQLRMRYDDGFVAYLNGVEVARRNAPDTVLWNSAATDSRTVGQAITPEVFSLSSFLDVLRPGTNVLAIHGLNASAADADFLTLAELEATTILLDGQRFFTEPTPGVANNAGVIGFVKDTNFSVDRGFYDAPFDVAITSTTPGSTIIYTTDGSEPTLTNGTRIPPASATSPGLATVRITGSTVLRAAAFKDQFAPSDVDTQTYIFLDNVLAQTQANVLARGFPATWGNNRVDYAVDPRVTTNPAYAANFKNDLLSIPSISIVMDNDDFFGAQDGIYSNATQRGERWERPGSIEMIDPANVLEFQANSGVRAFGGVGRNANTAKHSLRVLFKEEHGDPRLREQLFEGNPADEFNTLILKSNWNYSWTGDSTAAGGLGTQAAEYLRDAYGRQTATDMGLLAPDSRPVHLYINGLYWGLYHLTERPDESFASEHLGGADEDYDVIKPAAEFFDPAPLEVVSGDRVAWDQLFALAAQDTSDPARYEQISQLVDVDALIDYMLMIFYTGSRDAPVLLGNDNAPRNFYAIRNRNEGKFLFMAWDVEWSLENPTVNRVNVSGRDNPSYLFQRLKNNPDFRNRVADRIHQHFFNDGALTPQAAAARYTALRTEIFGAIVGESARWGDALRPTQPYTRDVEWTAEYNRLLTQYFPGRTNTVINQLISAGWYPNVSAPEYKVNGNPQHGGLVTEESLLTITDPNTSPGVVYYTLDGSDPRIPPVGTTTTYTFVSETTPARAIVPKVANGGDLLGTSWIGLPTNEPFNDSAWRSSASGPGVGYDTNLTLRDYNPFISINLREDMQTAPTNPSAFVRIPFTINSQSDINALDRLILRMRYDDGFVAYINGQLVGSANAPGHNGLPGTLRWNSAATTIRSDISAVNYQDFVAPQLPSSLLRVGTNILAIQSLNQSATSDDLLAQPLLIGEDLPNDVSPTAIAFMGNPIPINQSTQVKARIRRGATWSALSEAVFGVQIPLAITEIHYHPAAPTAAEAAAGFDDADDFEFIELTNLSSTKTINLVGVTIEGGVSIKFANASLAPGQRGVIVKNTAAFRARYGNAPLILGRFSGSLSNNGESLRLLDAGKQSLHDFSYDTSGNWPQRADGSGSSLEVISTSGPYGIARNWRASYEFHGTPGLAGAGAVNEVVVNEVISNTDAPSSDAIELHNPTGSPINVGGWFISDSNDDYRKFRIPDNTIIPAGGYLVFDEGDFNPTPQNPAPNHFALDSVEGDDVWLIKAASNGALLAFADHVEFRSTRPGEAVGRVPNATGALFPLASPTLGAVNSGPRAPAIQISEVMYNHPSNLPDLEYIELFNNSPAPVNLAGWRVSGGVDFTFDPGATVDAYSTIVLLSFNPDDPANASRLAAFRAAYNLDSSTALFGGYSGALDGSGDRIALLSPGTPPPGQPNLLPLFLEDRINYLPIAPWPTSADGGGDALIRNPGGPYGNDPASWTASAPTPGGHNIVLSASQTVGSLKLSSNSTLRLLPGRDKVLKVSSLTMASGALIDQADNAMIIDGGDLNVVRALLTAGRNASAGGVANGKWDGTSGIASSSAAALNASTESFSIGYALNSQLLTKYQTFRGVPVDDNDVLIRFTKNGDANLDGLVNNNDITILAGFYRPGTSGRHWHQADFNYDGFVDNNDITILAGFYRPNDPPIAPAEPASASPVAEQKPPPAADSIGPEPDEPLVAAAPASARTAAFSTSSIFSDEADILA